MLLCAVPASILTPGNEVMSLAKGEDGHLDCSMSNDSYPRTAHVVWKHNGYYVAIGPILRIRDFNQNQTGVYECTAFNGYGTPDSKKFHVSLDNVGGTNFSPNDIDTISVTQATLQMEGEFPTSGALSLHPICLLYLPVHLLKHTFDHLLS